MPPHRMVLRASLPALLVALSLTSAAAQVGSASGTPGATVDLPRLQIDNFGRVNANYFRGAQPQGRDYVDLAALGVKTIIDLTSDDSDVNEPEMAAAAGMKLIRMPMTTHQPPSSENLARFLAIVNDPVNQPVYVHCVGGRHRTGVMTAVYRMSQEGWAADKAFQEMKQYKYGADFLHSEFKTFVFGFKPPAPAVTTSTGAPAIRVTAGG